MVSQYRLAAAGIAFLLAATPLAAAELNAPKGEVILTIDGTIATTNTAGGADFDIEMLEAMAKATVKTTTPWTEGVTTFEGVPLKDLLAAVGATGTTISATALNDYSAPVPAADAETGAIVAYRMNGEYMPVRGKGPLWIIYPFDERPELKAEAVYARSIWQLRKMTLSQ